jgi:tetratricopeptide (TPR) repeat protein
LWIKSLIFLVIIVVAILCADSSEPHTAGYWKNENNILTKQGKYNEAIQVHYRSTGLDIQNANAWVDNGKGGILEKLDQELEAPVYYKVEDSKSVTNDILTKEEGWISKTIRILVEIVAFILFFIAYAAYFFFILAIDVFNQGLLYFYKTLKKEVRFTEGVVKGIKYIIIGILWILVGLFIHTMILCFLNIPRTYFYDIFNNDSVLVALIL